MSRKLIWAYALVLLVFFSGMLLVRNPAYAVTPIGFSIAFLGALAVFQIADYGLSLATRRHKPIMLVVALPVMFLGFTAMATAAWGILALLLTIIAFSANRPRKSAPVAVNLPEKVEPGDIEGAARRVAPVVGRADPVAT